MSKVLEKLANEKETVMTSIAYVVHLEKTLAPANIIHRLAYVMHKTPNVFPIIGGRKVAHLKSNIEALNVKLTAKEIDEIEDAHPFDHGFPASFIFMNSTVNGRSGEMWVNQMGGQYRRQPILIIIHLRHSLIMLNKPSGYTVSSKAN